MSNRIINGKELVFDEQKHRYLLDGVPVPSVTTILKVLDKPALVPWAVKMATNFWLEAVQAGRTDFEAIHKESKSVHYKKTAQAASIGTNVHNYAECFFKGLSLPVLETDEAKRSAEAFHKWVDAHNIEVLAVERRIYSPEYNYAGTCDLVAKIDGELAVLDYKTSTGIYPEMRLQTAAYQHALQEEKGIVIPSRWIVRFDKYDGEFEAKEFHDFESDFLGFKGALNIYHSLNAMKEKKK